MKTPEDEAFDDIARKQGAWGGGFTAKRAAAADKQEPRDWAAGEYEGLRWKAQLVEIEYTLSAAKPAHCQCTACKDGIIHASDCAVHNGPAYPAGECDCGVAQEIEQSEIFCGVDYADGVLAVSVMRRSPDGVAELLHSEQIELAQPAPNKKRPIESHYTSHVAYTRALEMYCDTLAQPVPQPVAWEQFYPDIGKNQLAYLPPSPFDISGNPQQRTWVGLTDEEREGIAQDYSLTGLGYQSPFKAIETMLKEKNG